MVAGDSRKKIAAEQHKPARRRYTRRKYDIRFIDDLWQADLVYMQAHATQNKGFKYLLTCIDTFSKYAWIRPIKSKEMSPGTEALESIISSSGRKPANLMVDQGSEFYNNRFKEIMKRKKINLYSSFSNLKASITERFNRTIKTS